MLNFLAFISSLTVLLVIMFSDNLNDVIRLIFISTILFILVDIVLNAVLGSLFILDCDLNYLGPNAHISIFKHYQLISIWTLLTLSILSYETSRMRYYFAKHAFRIHKLSSVYIASQVLHTRAQSWC